MTGGRGRGDIQGTSVHQIYADRQVARNSAMHLDGGIGCLLGRIAYHNGGMSF